MQSLEEVAARATAATGANGLAIAVIDDSCVAHVSANAACNNKGEPQMPDIVIYGTFMTKTV
jgi:hypothetical protein